MLWSFYGYSAVFSEGNAFFGSFGEKAFLKGITAASVSGSIPELLFVAFQSTFAAITTALETNDRPVVIDFVVSADAMVWPMVPQGVSNSYVQYARDHAPSFDQED